MLFTHDGRLISAGSSGIRIWDLETDQSEVISEEAASYLALTEDDRTLLTVGFGASKSRGDTVWLRDLVSGEVRQLTSHGERVMHVAVDPEGEFLVTGDTDGVVRVGPLSGGEPHLLLGHSGLIHSVAIDPEKRWLTSGGIDGTVRLWPIPEGQPFHTLPLSEIVGPLRGFTNYRVVPDDSEKSGFRVDVEPFAGWESSTE